MVTMYSPGVYIVDKIEEKKQGKIIHGVLIATMLGEKSRKFGWKRDCHVSYCKHVDDGLKLRVKLNPEMMVVVNEITTRN